MICWAIYSYEKIFCDSIRTREKDCVDDFLDTWEQEELMKHETCRKVVVKKWEKD